MDKKIIKTFVEGSWNDWWFLDWINDNLTDKRLISLPKDQHPDLIIFTGGEDVDPAFYKEEPGRFTSFNRKRDATCNWIYNYAAEKKIPMFGICRGAQFLTIKNGGKLIQHIENHGKFHTITTSDNEEFIISSSHHQMMFPYNLKKEEYRILAKSSNQLSKTYLNGDDKQVEGITEEPEIIYFPKTKSLAVQGHPESMSNTSFAPKWISKKINELLLCEK